MATSMMTATRAELLAGIEAEAERMQRYVVKLLDMTRLEAGGVKPKVEPLDAADVVAAVLKRAEPIAEGIWLDGDVSPGLPLLNADATLLHQTLFNLVENAIVHGARQIDGGEVRLAARMRDGGIIFHSHRQRPRPARRRRKRAFSIASSAATKPGQRHWPWSRHRQRLCGADGRKDRSA